MNAGLRSAGFARRLASLVYECFPLFAVAVFASLPFLPAGTELLTGWLRHVFQVYLFLVLGLYLTWCWTRGGQTLPMKAWKLRIIRADGGPLSPTRAVVRYALAWVSLLIAGAGFLWALVDRDGQFLHDRLSGCRIVIAG